MLKTKRNIGYSRKYLYAFFENPNILIDNNLAERTGCFRPGRREQKQAQ